MPLPDKPGRSRTLLFSIVAAALIVRCFYLFFFVDLSRDYYWEYGEIAKNLHMGKGYSLFFHQGEKIEFHTSPAVSPYPSAYMMPGYVGVLYPLFLIDNVVLRNALLLLLQALVGTAAVALMFRFIRTYVGRREAFVAAAIMGFLPEIIYASGSYTPTVLFHLLFLLILPVLYLLRDRDSLRWELAAGMLFACIIYIRPELSLFAILFLFGLLFAGRRRAAFRVGIVALLLVLPWQIRNAAVFQEWIPFTTSGGLNFFRGHNETELGSFGDETTIEGLRDLPHGKDFEPEMSRLFYRRAIEIIDTKPMHEFGRTGAKLDQLWFRDPADARSASLLYVVPWIVVLASAAAGLLRHGTWATHRILLLYLVCSTIVAVVFFVLPRYQTMMKVAVIPFSAIGFVWLWDTVRSKIPRGKSEAHG